MNSSSLSRGLAFFSVGLGLTKLLAPRRLGRAIGVGHGNEVLLRCLGIRELASGIGMMQGNTAAFAWSRIAGDAVDLALLAAACRSMHHRRQRLAGTIALAAGITALDFITALALSRNPGDPEWRVTRNDRAGMARKTPHRMRRYVDEAMADDGRVAWGGSQTPSAGNGMSGVQAREEEATRQFGPGD